MTSNTGDGEPEAIIIGSGIGGLCVGALLSLKGWLVHIYEQHHELGGCLHCFKSKGYEFDTGLHYVGDLNPGSGARVIFDKIAGVGEIVWHKVPGPHDVLVCGDERYEFGEEKEQMELFSRIMGPNLAQEYFSLMKRTKRSGDIYVATSLFLPWWLLWIQYLLCPLYLEMVQRSAQDVLMGIGCDRRQTAIATYLWGNYGELPSRASFALHTMVAMHWFKGNFYPVGGPTAISRAIIRKIENSGTRSFIKARRPVSSIERTESDIKNGLYSVKIREKIHKSPVVIAACGKRNLEKLIEGKAMSSISTISFFVVYVALKGCPRALGVPAHNIWRARDWDYASAQADWFSSQGNGEPAMVFISSGSAKDPSHNINKSTMSVICPCPYEWFKDWSQERCMHRGADYKELKSRIESKLMRIFYEELPHLRGFVDFVETGSPLTYDNYLGTDGGAVYGVRKQGKLGRIRDKSGVYLAGQDVFSAGILGGLLGGVFCAANVSWSCIEYLFYLHL